ncbi:MAG: M23 family metallopeptidase [Chloroflexota bacterium]
MQTKNRDMQGFAVLLIALVAGGYLLLRNTAPAVSYTIAGPSPTSTTGKSSWQEVIQNQLVNGATLIPTHDLPEASFAPPTLPPVTGTPILLQPGQVFQGTTPTATRYIPITPTRPGPTSVPSPTGQVVVSAKNNPNLGQFSPPAEVAPLSMDPRDHFWFKRPVDSSANSVSLQYYPYGSDGPQNVWRVHHGIDMPNPIGKEVRAAGPGRVVWAADNYIWMENGRVTDAAYTYGNVVIIEHDFGYQGQPVFTLYAHLAVILAQINQHVDTGDIVGLSGESGVVSGPHVHFEVRVGKNLYYNTRNPILWMAPYLDRGVIAGKIIYRDGKQVEDATVELWQRGRVVDTTTTYVRTKPPSPGISTGHVNSDDVWGENFVFGDVVAGDYQVVVTVGGLKLSRDINVRPATTTFIDLGQAPIGLSAPSTPTDSPTIAP